ncbi:probable tubulin polyglutamylase TTLL2 [Anguilla rostrata]|uniref:probable tubulin polyglutamylase TTLL2 n=1 Tax=Anguilla rostrata TaxID=7938 RepID=UPI0030D4D9C6
MAAGVCGVTPMVFRLQEGGPDLVREVLLERGWVEFDPQEQEEGDWNLHWRSSTFRNADYETVMPWQRLNHHPKTVGITRKDCLARNLKRMKGTFSSALYDFSPTAFILPNDYTRFLAEYSRNRLANRGRPGYWICKPVDLSRGRGIFIFEDIKDLTYDSSVIVQRYVSDPLLISGYKFDLRIYVCVKSFHPLTVYIHQEGLVRFATEKYDLTSLDNLYAHLTNTSINKFGQFYTKDKEQVGPGCKWTMSKFRSFLHNQGVDELLLWQRINSIVTLTLLTIAPSIPRSPNCIELLGFDILIDASFKPWLLEVNYSPALSLDCPADVVVKKGLLNDLFDLMGYRKVDSLRQRGYLRQRHRHPSYFSHRCMQPSFSPVLLFPRFTNKPNPDDQGEGESHVDALHDDSVGCSDSRGFPLVETKQIGSARENAARSSRPSHGPRLKPRPKTKAARAEGDRRAYPLISRTSEHVLWTETIDSEAFFENSAPAPVDSVKQPSPVRLWKLPAIQIHKYTPPTYSWDHVTKENRRPLSRVGDFILTFPFNEVTLKASRNKLDVKTAAQEVQRITNWLASPRSHVVKRRRRDSLGRCLEKDKFGPLFWGPRNPPLLSECCPTG